MDLDTNDGSKNTARVDIFQATPFFIYNNADQKKFTVNTTHTSEKLHLASINW